MFFRVTKVAQALLILAVTAWSVPCLSPSLDAYIKDSTSLIGFLSTVTGMLAVLFIFIRSVFFLLSLSLVAAEIRCCSQVYGLILHLVAVM